MIKDSIVIKITLANKKEASLEIKALTNNTIFFIDPNDAFRNAEAPCQLLEGHFYQYKIDPGYWLKVSTGLKDSNSIISVNKFDATMGEISPNTYVGTLAFDVFHENEKCGVVKVEVRSVKSDYRNDYRKMLSDITDHCVDLVFQHYSPVTQTVEIDFEKGYKTWYQRFAFIKSLLDSEEFDHAVNKVLSTPVTKWTESEIDKDIRSAGRLKNRGIRQIANATNRIFLPENHLLRLQKLDSVPSKIKVDCKKETLDTPENRFIKYALNSFLSFVGLIKTKSDSGSKISMEASAFENKLEQFLNHSMFKEVSSPQILDLNNPVLQRKEGYREILRAWLMFDLAAKLVWHGGDDVYDVGKRDVAVLYEYWLFFILLDIVSEVFGIEPKKDLIVSTKDKLGLQLQQGKHFPVEGVCKKYLRKFNVQFSYNRTFSGKKDYPMGGSWTKNMRPDYTLSIWPDGIGQEQAETEELIVHIHFDAKYRVNKLTTIFGEETEGESIDQQQESLNIEKDEQSKGNYKRVDLLKMHSYRDAIRRTAGAYVLYPGENERPYTRKGFHELLPGLGAFAISPSLSNSGCKELKDFIKDVVDHYLNRASQREKVADKHFVIYKDEPKDEDKVEEMLPEEYGLDRIIPDETFVLIGYCKNELHFNWVLENNLYNSRVGNQESDIMLRKDELGARYLLLHIAGQPQTNKIYKLKNHGPVIFSKKDLIIKNYPSPPNVEYYLVYNFENGIQEGFDHQTWDIEKLIFMDNTRKIKRPFAVSITELMKVALKK